MPPPPCPIDATKPFHSRNGLVAEEYEDRAVALANDPEALAGLRAKLIDARTAKGGLFDPEVRGVLLNPLVVLSMATGSLPMVAVGNVW